MDSTVIAMCQIGAKTTLLNPACNLIGLQYLCSRRTFVHVGLVPDPPFRDGVGPRPTNAELKEPKKTTEMKEDYRGHLQNAADVRYSLLAFFHLSLVCVLFSAPLILK